MNDFEPHCCELIPGGAVHKVKREYRAVAGVDECPTELWVHSPAMDLIASGHWKVSGDGLSIVPMTQAEIDQHHEDELDALKAVRCAEIDAKTYWLISLGFSHAGKQFSLSPAAQTQMVGIDLVRDDPAITYPIKWATLGNDGSHELADSAEVHLFYLTGCGTYRFHFDTGNALKEQIRAATTVAEVDAIQDTR